MCVCPVFHICRVQEVPRGLDHSIRPSGTADTMVGCSMLVLGTDVQRSARAVWALTTEHFLQPLFSVRKKTRRCCRGSSLVRSADSRVWRCTCSQHSEGTDRWIAVSLRPSCLLSTQPVPGLHTGRRQAGRQALTGLART